MSIFSDKNPPSVFRRKWSLSNNNQLFIPTLGIQCLYFNIGIRGSIAGGEGGFFKILGLSLYDVYDNFMHRAGTNLEYKKAKQKM